MIFVRNKKAFTLIELLVTMGIFAILISGASWFIIGTNRDLAVMWEQLITQNQGKKTLDHVVNYVRKAETSSVGSYALETADPYNLVFYANLDSDSLVEKVQFWLDNDKSFKETITKPSSTASSDIYENGTSNTINLADNITNQILDAPVPLFLYYDENYTGSEVELAEGFYLTDVRMVKVQLELEKDPTKSPEPLHVESTALIRSTKTN